MEGMRQVVGGPDPDRLQLGGAAYLPELTDEVSSRPVLRARAGPSPLEGDQALDCPKRAVQARNYRVLRAAILKSAAASAGFARVSDLVDERDSKSLALRGV